MLPGAAGLPGTVSARGPNQVVWAARLPGAAGLPGCCRVAGCCWVNGFLPGSCRVLAGSGIPECRGQGSNVKVKPSEAEQGKPSEAECEAE